jgi:hypothetical protein
MEQVAVVCRRLTLFRNASVVECWNTQRARGRSSISYLCSRPDGETAMRKRLSCALSRLSSSEPVAIVRMLGNLPGLHQIHLYWPRAGMTDLPKHVSSAAKRTVRCFNLPFGRTVKKEKIGLATCLRRSTTGLPRVSRRLMWRRPRRC